ncbi:MAG: DEAD/DEAH box helicase [Anaerolineae bacterium]|nr:DEAD/DEAH box helicase [Anaerolineae bacterium]
MDQTCEVYLRPGAERALAAVASGQYASRLAYRLQLQAERLALVAGFDELISLDVLSFTPFDYQVRAAQTALRRFRGRGLLCDEVGLGKTIEAGLVLKEYRLRQMADRVLIITPPALVEQWREELANKFNLDDFVASHDPSFRELGSRAWVTFPRIIASLATARRPEHRQAITSLVYDLVIVDEAHHLKNRASVSWKFVNALQKKYILLLTATPVQNNLDELYNLITILKPGQLKTPREFRRHFVVRGDPRLPKNRGRLRELLADVMVRHARGQVGVRLPPRRAQTVRLQLGPEERALYDDVSDLVRRLIGLAPASEPEGEGLPVHSAGPQPASGPDGTDARLPAVHRFTLRTLQREIGSSPAAARSTLLALAEHRAPAAQRQALLALAERAGSFDSWAKGEALERLLLSTQAVTADRREKLIIFTHFRATLELLATMLRRLGVDAVVYHGQLSRVEKDDAIRHFEQRAQVLLSTEAAGEGRNLQFCRLMLNFDLPWNPQRIEQRVGRIHRVGQTRPVEILNLAAEGTVEDFLLEVLDRKLNMFELVIGEMDMILGQLEDERSFEEIVMDTWAQARTPEQVAAGFEHLGDALIHAREAYQRTREYDEALFGEDLSA